MTLDSRERELLNKHSKAKETTSTIWYGRKKIVDARALFASCEDNHNRLKECSKEAPYVMQ